MWLKAASVLAWPLLASAIRGGKMMTWSGIYNTGSVLIDKGFDLILESTGLEDKCPYVDNMGAVLREKLPDFIKGQTRAISMLSDAVSSWEYRKMYSGTEEPLVLALAGDTGTGKSETALRVAELLLQKKDLLCLTDYRVSTPRGFLVLRGEEYSAATYSGRDGPAVVQRLLIDRITTHLQACGGNGIIFVDEVQKFVNGSIELFLAGISDKMGDLAATHWLTGKSIRVSTRNLVVMLATDLGRDEIRQLLLLQAGNADAIPPQKLRTALTARFDAHWSNNKFTSAVTETVPYFPLDATSLREILRLQLHEMSIKEIERGSLADIVYDSLLLSYLTSHKNVNYLKYSTADGGSSIIVAEKGGRSITKKGPLLTLQALIVRYMQPWRADWILHIGVEPSFTADGQSNEPRLKILGAPGSDEKRRPFLYLQWCRVTPRQESEAQSSYVSSRKSSRKNKLDLEVQVNPDWDKVLTCSYEKGGGHIFTDTTSESSRVLVPDGVINSRVGLLYVLSDVDVFTPNNCETKWIGHLDSSANK